MLPESLRLVVSAYAAGDLSPRRRTSAIRLLRHSADARKLLKELQFDRLQILSMTSPKLPDDFTDRVLNALPHQTPIIRLAPRKLSGRRPTVSAALAAAAAVLIATAVGTYSLVTLQQAPAPFSHPPVRTQHTGGMRVAQAVLDPT